MGALYMHNSFERHHGHGHIRGMRCDAMFACSKDGVDPVKAIDRGASRAGLAFVAGIGGIAKIVTTCALKQIAAGASHVSKLRRSSGEKRFGKNRVTLLDRF